MLALSGLTKSVPGGRVLFANLALHLAPGECVALMGESGVGKSTLLNLVAGLDLPDSGSIVFDGQALESLNDDARTRLRRARMGFVFQAFHILPHLDLARNVALPLILNGGAATPALARATELLGRVGLAGRGADLPAQLSGGELQRVAIARALAHRPALILADEPTGNLDPRLASQVLDLLIDATREAGAAVLLVTHSELAARRADRVLLLTARGLQPHQVLPPP